jgi:sec-independent protein translocase protein TatC
MARSTNPAHADEHEEAQSRMTFGEHLEELRKRIIRAMLGSLITVTLCIYFYKEIIDVIARPYKLACLTHGITPVLTTLKPQEAFLTSITLAVQAGLVLASPWIIYQLWQFVAAGLYERERKIVYRYTAPSALLFLLGIAFFYFVVLPMTLNFFIQFNSDTSGPLPQVHWFDRIVGYKAPPGTAPATTPSTNPITATSSPTTNIAPIPQAPLLTLPVLTGPPEAPPPHHAVLYFDSRDNTVKARTEKGVVVFMVSQEGSLFATTWRYDDYLSFVTFTALIFGLAFELPMVMLILAQVGIVETQTYRNVRKYAYFGILIGAVIAAPSGDLSTLFFLFIPLIALYEFGIIAAALVTRGRNEN